MTSVNERIQERMRSVEISKKEGKIISYNETTLLDKIIVSVNIERKVPSVRTLDKEEEIAVHHKKLIRRISSARMEMVLPRAEEIAKNRKKIVEWKGNWGRGELKSTFYNDIEEATNLSKEESLISKRFEDLSFLGVIVGSIILAYTFLFFKSLGLLILPLSTLGLGLIVTWLVAKMKIDKIRKESSF